MKMEIVDKLIFWIAGLSFISLYGISMEMIVACLLAAIIVCVRLAYAKSRYINYIYEGLMVAYFVGMFVIELCFSQYIYVAPFIAFVPLLLYDILQYRMIVSGLACVAALVTCVTGAVKSGYTAGTDTYVSVTEIVFVILFAIVSVVLQFKTAGYVRLTDKIKHISDDAREKNMELYDKNNELIARQDYEIHVATLEERNRIAREIHDNVGHMITRAILMTGAIATIEKDEVVKQHVEVLSDTLNQAMNNIRESVHDLHDDAINLEKAVAEMIEAFPNLKIEFDYSMAPEIPKELKMCYIAVTKEALNNVSKHSNADSVYIKMREQPGFYQLMIADNGKVSGNNFLGGMGIANMRERVRKLGGSFNIRTDDGFKIMISVMK